MNKKVKEMEARKNGIRDWTWMYVTILAVVLVGASVLQAYTHSSSYQEKQCLKITDKVEQAECLQGIELNAERVHRYPELYSKIYEEGKIDEAYAGQLISCHWNGSDVSICVTPKSHDELYAMYYPQECVDEGKCECEETKIEPTKCSSTLCVNNMVCPEDTCLVDSIQGVTTLYGQLPSDSKTNYTTKEGYNLFYRVDSCGSKDIIYYKPTGYYLRWINDGSKLIEKSESKTTRPCEKEIEHFKGWDYRCQEETSEIVYATLSSGRRKITSAECQIGREVCAKAKSKDEICKEQGYERFTMEETSVGLMGVCQIANGSGTASVNYELAKNEKIDRSRLPGGGSSQPIAIGGGEQNE